MNRGSTLFLKISIFVIGIPVLGLCLFLLPQIAMEAFEQAQKGAGLAYVVFGILIIMYGSAIPFYIALYQGLLLLSYIDKNQAFSSLSVNALRKIKNSAKLIFGMYVVALPFIFVIAEWDDAPGLVLIGMVIAGSSLIVAVFVAVLQRLLQQAIHIKSENDLTV
ncbi:DUF2975 domain-containing protein [Aquibacillus koreensis]|uniref:DUF2975 domain-containing protein n=1 Tax=Aquibacillus koreensis TaxID=279446 RepID=A0A9X4AJY6_9BACI|nr:DUF2975 domain-containing protein [Aquibacillus koreensis]MCT2535336.1 DUF2975 domain-containing protein [Aquibacillus koreensis]MDC3422501.1 DUF2975 domain-containing protein [Aquibacillus koreensis]